MNWHTQDGTQLMRWQRMALLLGLCLLWIAYLVQLSSPLRVNKDAQSLLGIASSASDGKGFLLNGERSHFPIGYPLLIVGLERVGLASSAGFIGLNLLAIAAGMTATAFLLKRSFGFDEATILAIAILTLLCWVYIKHVTLPLSDLPYFGLAQSSLAFLTWSAGRPLRSRMAGLSAALVLAAAAIAVRTVGIALLPVLILGCLPQGALRMLWDSLTKDRRRAILVALGLLAITSVVSVPILQTRYFHESLDVFRHRVGLVEQAHLKLWDWGELVLNTSAAKLPRPVQPLVIGAGMIVPVLLFLGAWQKRQLAVIDVYFATYAAILLLWPYGDARFWLPVFPIMLGYAWLLLRRYTALPAVRRGTTAYLLVFSLFGVVALIYSSWISLAGDRFADRFAGGAHRASYRAAFSLDTPESDHGAPADPQTVRLVRRYSARNLR
jgi:hypothetical protein